MKAGRRRFLGGVAAFGLVAPVAAQQQRAGAESRRVTLEVARLADNGHSVPIRVAVESPMTPADHVKKIVLVSERNPRPIMATFHLGPAAGKAEVATRVRLNGSQKVTAVVHFSDGTEARADAEVEVTESACLDAG